MDDERGVIRNRNYANRVNDFRNLRYGNITPTDVDGALDYKNICYVYIETKYKGAELPFGQRLFLERQQDDMEKVKPVITIVATYDNNESDIDVGNTTVTEYRFHKKWHTTNSITTTKELMDRFINWVENGF